MLQTYRRTELSALGRVAFMRSSVFLLLLLACCSSPKPAFFTGEPLIDKVAELVGDGSPCISFQKFNRVVINKPEPNGPPGLLTPDRFDNPAVREAASAIAVDWRTEQTQDVKTIGPFNGDRCLLYVEGPAISGDFAFLYFSSPGGAIGAYAFEKDGNEWKIAERVQIGWW